MISIIQEKLSVSNPFSLKFINYNKFSSKLSLILDDQTIETYRSFDSANKKVKANSEYDLKNSNLNNLNNLNNRGTVYNRVVVDTLDILSSQEYESTPFYLFKSGTEDSTTLIFPLKEKNLKEKIEESSNLYSFLDEIQKVRIKKL